MELKFEARVDATGSEYLGGLLTRGGGVMIGRADLEGCGRCVGDGAAMWNSGPGGLRRVVGVVGCCRLGAGGAGLCGSR